MIEARSIMTTRAVIKTKQMRKGKHETKYMFHNMEIGLSLDAVEEREIYLENAEAIKEKKMFGGIGNGNRKSKQQRNFKLIEST